MPPMQIVFLFDLNAFTDDECKSLSNINNHLLCLRLTCLKILTHFQAYEPNLKWGFKFFDSCGSLSQSMCKYSFSNVSLENFEILENEICVRYQRHVSLLDALAASAQRNDLTISNEESSLNEDKKTLYPIQVMHQALTQILYEFQWNNQISLFSPSTKSNKYKLGADKNDILFLVSKCPTNEETFNQYFGINYESITASKFKKLMLPPSLSEKFLLKSSILWIWLNTNSSNISGGCTDGLIHKMPELLKSLKCVLIPFSTISRPPYMLKFEENEIQTIRMDLFNSLVPFSTLFSQCINHPFYEDTHIFTDSIIFNQNTKMLVNINRISSQWTGNSADPGKSLLHNSNGEYVKKSGLESDSPKSWSKFTVHFAISRKTSLPTCDIFLCLPSISSDESNFKLFQEFSKVLILKDISLFITCESNCGEIKPGLLSPLSETSAVISILDLNETFKYKNNILENCCTLACNEKGKETLCESEEVDVVLESSCIKPFQMECLEQWFEPTSSISKAASLCKEQSKSYLELKSFYKKLSIKLSKNTKPLQEKENIAPMDEVQENDSSQILESYEDISYDELIKLLREVYDSALKSDAPVLRSAKKIVNSCSSFFQQKPSDTRSLEEAVRDFMAEFFSINHRKLIESFSGKQDADKIIQECQLQILLALETEVLFPSSERSNCVNNVTSFLRTMSFYSGALELNKFLLEVLRENYKDSLYDVLVEVGDELDIPLFEEDNDSFDEQSEPPSSSSAVGSNNSLLSAMSLKSSSSASSRTGSRKFIPQRSDIPNTSKVRQIVLTKTPSKKKKHKNICSASENVPVRYSPRLSSKKKKERHQKAVLNPGHVRRNLFPKGQKIQTPNCSVTPRSKKRRITPKAHHILKTDFVPETPLSKQGQSALQRRKSFICSDSELPVKEIPDTPETVKQAPDASNKEILTKLSGLTSHNFAQPARLSLPSCSNYSHYTPDSKRRLSLKLFSKFLTSPTARRGLKRCSKRLFDQVSPHVENEVRKKPKLEKEDEILDSSEASPHKGVKSPGKE